jgi:hypothetical protein
MRFKTIRKIIKFSGTVLAESGTRLHPTAQRPTTCDRPKSRLGNGLAAHPSGANGLRSPQQRSRAALAGAVTTRRPRGGVLVGGSVVAQRRQGVAGDLEGATGKVLSKEERAGAHRNGGSMVRRRKRRRAAVSNGGGVAPMVVDVQGGVLQHRCGMRKRDLAPIQGMTKLGGPSLERGYDGDA